MTFRERLRITLRCDYRAIVLKNALLEEWWDPLRENFFEGIGSIIVVAISPVALLWTLGSWLISPIVVALRPGRFPDKLLNDLRLNDWRARRF